VWTPGEHLVIDWGVIAGVHVFCAVLAWSRWRFVRLAADEKQATTRALLAECFEQLGGVPKVVLADRMGCVKGGVVANHVVPTADYVRFASHYRFWPDFCQAADSESKGIVEALVGYGRDDFFVPLLLERQQLVAGGERAAAARVLADLAGSNEHARAWCEEVNAAVHSQICAVPTERLQVEAELLAPYVVAAPVDRAGADDAEGPRSASARPATPCRQHCAGPGGRRGRRASSAHCRPGHGGGEDVADFVAGLGSGGPEPVVGANWTSR